MRARHGLLVFAVAAVTAYSALAQNRRAFEIAAGPVSGDLYVQGERLAGVISHPPGLSRCADETLCGPEGLIASARATASGAEGLLAIARGEIASAIAPADVAAAMRLNAGKGKQNKSRLRAVGIVGDETLVVVASVNGPVKSIRGLRKRWVGIGARGSRTRVAANALLAAAGIDHSGIRAGEADGLAAVKLLRERRLDAMIWIGAKLPNELTAMIKQGTVRIVPLDARSIARLTASRLGFAPKKINGLDTVAAPLVWLADEEQPADIVFRVARAAFNARNAALLRPAVNDPSSMTLVRPPADFVLPLHAGAARLFTANVRPSN